ncbi:DNA-directed RNA polymerase sigma-70 factor [Azorhizobium oxalatiphilum]|uniref:DNA-directed RNA polymerase sigma-70 factor n=1 Tax=Azorhizobium oxalatiphilum TaxID=980631 RepID=A0A917CBG5_9HYPH|nr:sigma-70 family RNA polymerase sigma factor [Azorhizobium oxalatiphilum]GGF78360.1 DNA-directed RNA polymerase sigma-70 factor [Azorhizobium oxalatiphilum]
MSWDLHDLFVRHARDITAALRRRGLTEETAADLTQDTFVRVLVSPPGQTATTHNPAAYLFRVARNLCVDHKRRERVLPGVDLSPDDFSAIVDPAPSPEATLYSRQRLELTEAALAELPERTRRAFQMHRVEEMTLAEVAAELGLSTSRTWTLIRDAYEHIAARLTGL